MLTWSFVKAEGAEKRYAGGDISLLPDYEHAGSVYKDKDGNEIAQLLPWLHDKGMNAMRVRLFNNPEAFVDNDPNACQSLPYILPLCREIADNGFDLMLDFHYSDTWADPSAQWIPKAWEGLDEEALAENVYEFTSETLATLRENGIVPRFIQPGNEISYGMLWSPYGAPEDQQHKTYINSDANWQRLGLLLRSAVKACREVCPEAEIIIHTERASQVDVLTNFYRSMADLNVDYDIVGLSYYPYFHGKMSVLDNALTTLEKEFPDRPIMIVETGYPYKWEIPGTSQPVDYEYSAEGQERYTRELVAMLESHPRVTGLFWWWMEFNAYGTDLSDWYNAPLFDSLTGMALPALDTLCSFATNDSCIGKVMDSEPEQPAETETWLNLQGQQISRPASPGIYIVRKGSGAYKVTAQ